MRTRKKYTTCQKIVRIAPIAVSLLIILFGRLDYYIGPDGRYSYGPMAITVYGCACLYTLCTVLLLLTRKKGFSESSKKIMLSGIAVWFVIALIQCFNPTWLLSSMAVTIMTQFIYISLENPKDYLDYEMKNVFNRYAFENILAEIKEKNSAYYIISIVFSNTNLLKTSVGIKEVPKILQIAADYLSGHTKEPVYRTNSNVISMIITDKDKYEKFKNNIDMNIDYKSDNGIRIDAKYFINIMECPQASNDVGEIMNIIDFVSTDEHNDYKDGIVMVDKEVIDKKNYLFQVESLIQKAINEDGFDIYYQPIYSTGKRKFVSAEALIRLKDTQTLGFISPELFIPIAEKKGMIRKIGNIVFRKVCNFANYYHLDTMGLEYLEINLSGIQGVDKHLVSSLTECMKEYNIPPEFINLEITETASVEAADMLTVNMKKLRKIGCKFSMDDFGTGYSNFAKMAETNFELIKLDKSLIWPCFEENNKNPLIILNGCIDIISKLGLQIVAEGVETREQADLLTKKGVTYLQGYYFSKPLCESDFIEFIQKNN